MNWSVGEDRKNGYTLHKGQRNPQYCLCKRYFPTLPTEKEWFGELIPEVISVDHSLFPKEEETVLTEEQAKNILTKEGYQVLRVFCMLDEKGDLDVPDIARQRVEGFEFCGFDLSDFVVSAILNCGSFTTGDYFSKAFDHRELNEFGLIPDYKTAIEVRSKLMDEYPEDEHAYCAIFAIWRRI